MLNKWYENCKAHLECHTSSRLIVERDIKDPLRSNDEVSIIRPSTQRGLNPQTSPNKQVGRWNLEPYLLAHEFLYLLCNCEDRLVTIRKTHRFDLASQKGNINHWELINKDTGKHRVSLLSCQTSHTANTRSHISTF